MILFSGEKKKYMSLHFCQLFGNWFYRNEYFIVFFLSVLNLTINQSIQGVVLAYSHVAARIMLCTSLTYEYVAGFDSLAPEKLDSQPLAV